MKKKVLNCSRPFHLYPYILEQYIIYTPMCRLYFSLQAHTLLKAHCNIYANFSEEFSSFR